MSTNITHGRMSVVDELGNVTIMHQETSSSDVLVDRTRNTQGDNSLSAIPSDVDNLEKLVNKLGKLAFRSHVEYADLVSGFIVNNFTTEIPGSALDAVAGKRLNDRLAIIENADVLVIGDDIETTEDTLPVSEINDDVTSEALTWSSSKIQDKIDGIIDDNDDSATESTMSSKKIQEKIGGVYDYIDSVYDNFYIDLIEGDDEFHFTTTVTLSEISDAYNRGKYLWVTSNVIHLPLRLHPSDTEWIFSGYTDGRACDIKIDQSGVTRTYTDVITRDILDTEFDTETNTVNFN